MRTIGALPEKMLDALDVYMEGKPERLRRTLYWKGVLMILTIDAWSNVSYFVGKVMGCRVRSSRFD